LVPGHLLLAGVGSTQPSTRSWLPLTAGIQIAAAIRMTGCLKDVLQILIKRYGHGCPKELPQQARNPRSQLFLRAGTNSS
jgi:hypothetical protein